MALSLTSSAFAQGERIPTLHTCEGADTSPPLRWDGAPPETRSFALVCSDPDAPVGTWYHWGIFDIPATADHLDTDFPTDARVGGISQAVTDFRRTGYGGPCPPRGHGTHHYHFRLMALDIEQLDVAASPDCRDVEREAGRHVIAEAVLTGLYSRG